MGLYKIPGPSDLSNSFIYSSLVQRFYRVSRNVIFFVFFFFLHFNSMVQSGELAVCQDRIGDGGLRETSQEAPAYSLIVPRLHQIICFKAYMRSLKVTYRLKPHPWARKYSLVMSSGPTLANPTLAPLLFKYFKKRIHQHEPSGQAFCSRLFAQVLTFVRYLHCIFSQFSPPACTGSCIGQIQTYIICSCHIGYC